MGKAAPGRVRVPVPAFGVEAVARSAAPFMEAVVTATEQDNWLVPPFHLLFFQDAGGHAANHFPCRFLLFPCDPHHFQLYFKEN